MPRIATDASACPPRWPTSSRIGLARARTASGRGTKRSSVLVFWSEKRSVPSTPRSASAAPIPTPSAAAPPPSARKSSGIT
jgi:hypothetical protein